MQQICKLSVTCFDYVGFNFRLPLLSTFNDEKQILSSSNGLIARYGLNRPTCLFNFWKIAVCSYNEGNERDKILLFENPCSIIPLSRPGASDHRIACFGRLKHLYRNSNWTEYFVLSFIEIVYRHLENVRYLGYDHLQRVSKSEILFIIGLQTTIVKPTPKYKPKLVINHDKQK